MPLLLRFAAQRPENMQPRYLTLFIILFVFCGAAACGQKGPLFLPGSPSEIQQTLNETPDAEEADDEDEEDEEDIN